MSLINTAITGIRAAQLGLSTTGHNIVNADTEGYTRQTVVNETGTPMRTGVGHIGTGVLTTDIIRQVDQGLTDRVNADTSTLSDVDTFLREVSKVDNLFAGDSTNLAQAMDRFFNAVNESASDPSSMIGRELLLTESRVMIDSFRNVEQRLRDQNQTVNARLDTIAGEVSTLATSLAEMNRSISFAASGDRGQPNDLLDKRDQMVRELSQYVEVTTMERQDGTMDISIGQGQPLVTGLQARQVITQTAAGDSSRRELAFVDGRRTESAGRSLQGGEIGGLLRFRDEALGPALNQVGRLVLGVAGRMNEQHQLGMDLEGSTGGPLFTDINASGLASGRVSEFSGNSPGTRSLGVQIKDVAGLTDSSYELRFSGPNGRYSMVRLNDGEKVAEGILGENRPERIAADGFEVRIDGGRFESGDRFAIQPTRFAAGNLQTEVRRPESLALASPLRTLTGEGNRGGGTISAGEVSSTDTAAFAEARRLSPPVMIRFTSPTTYDVLDYSDPSAPKPLEPPLMDQPFTPGATTDVFPTDPGGTAVSTDSTARAQQVQVNGSDNGYTAENITVETIDPETGFLREQFLAFNDHDSAADIAARLSAMDGVKASARSELQLSDFRATGADLMTVKLNGVDLTDPDVILPGETSPQPIPDPPTADFLRDRINASQALRDQGIRATSDSDTLTIRGSGGEDLQLVTGGTSASLDMGVNGAVQEQDIGPGTHTVGGRIDVQLAANTRLYSDEPNGIFGGLPEATGNYMGYQVTLGSGTGEQGAPAAGDRFYIEYNTGGTADNRNAAAMLDLNRAMTLGEGNLTYQQAYGQLVEDVGIQTSQARQSQQASESMLRQSMDAWSSVSGVNVEEEAARLIQLEQHYNASARLISLASEMFDTLLNM